MIKNLSEYFLPEQEFYLHKIVYDRIDGIVSKKEFMLNCADNINVEVGENSQVRVMVSRTLSFEPDEMFYLSVSFGANLRFEPQKANEYNWNEINLAEEFRDNGNFVTDNLMSRIALLIAQITSSFGQQPLVLPPNVARPNNEE
ncbi:MAG: hypothetical protein K2O34_13030 [Acetatifactor sp.]|nr:hypothetical protein [Acetatifactor sp.]